jgi:hypothetical protein
MIYAFEGKIIPRFKSSPLLSMAALSVEHLKVLMVEHLKVLSSPGWSST